MLWSEKEIWIYFKRLYSGHFQQIATERLKIGKVPNIVHPDAIDLAFIKGNINLKCKNWDYFNAVFDK